MKPAVRAPRDDRPYVRGAHRRAPSSLRATSMCKRAVGERVIGVGDDVQPAEFALNELSKLFEQCTPTSASWLLKTSSRIKACLRAAMWSGSSESASRRHSPARSARRRRAAQRMRGAPVNDGNQIAVGQPDRTVATSRDLPEQQRGLALEPSSARKLGSVTKDKIRRGRQGVEREQPGSVGSRETTSELRRSFTAGSTADPASGPQEQAAENGQRQSDCSDQSHNALKQRARQRRDQLGRAAAVQVVGDQSNEHW